MSKTRREYRMLMAACNAGLYRDVTPTFYPIGYVAQPDMETTNRLSAWAKDHLASLTPERREALEREFGK